MLFSQQPQIPFCSKRKDVALFIYRRERVCATHFLRPKRSAECASNPFSPSRISILKWSNGFCRPHCRSTAQRAGRVACGVRRHGETRKALRWVWSVGGLGVIPETEKVVLGQSVRVGWVVWCLGACGCFSGSMETRKPLREMWRFCVSGNS